jgi:hypothetical protein
LTFGARHHLPSSVRGRVGLDNGHRLHPDSSLPCPARRAPPLK